jgi:hypothetical protein
MNVTVYADIKKDPHIKYQDTLLYFKMYYSISSMLGFGPKFLGHHLSVHVTLELPIYASIV